MDLGDWASIVIVATFIATFFWLWLGPTLYRPLKDGGILKLHRFLDDLAGPKEEYQYFTIGHIVWSETSLKEIERVISSLSVGSVPGVGPHPKIPRFLLHVNEPEKRVYFLPTNDSSFDWGSVPHYEDYVNSDA